jgi:hypothetical protein
VTLRQEGAIGTDALPSADADSLMHPTIAPREVLTDRYKENDVTITHGFLLRASAVAAAVAGLIFIGVQIGHPSLDATSIITTDVMIRNSLKLVMTALALAGVYLFQVTKIGVLGLVGFVVFALGYLSMLGTEYVAALVLPSIAGTSTAYVNDVIAVATNQPATGDIGWMQGAILFTGLTYIGGGVLFAIALFRANVLARWASALLAVGTLSAIGAGIVPQYERLFAIPTGLALVGLGYSLWRAQRTSAALPVLNPVSSNLDPVGVR